MFALVFVCDLYMSTTLCMCILRVCVCVRVCVRVCMCMYVCTYVHVHVFQETILRLCV